MAPARTINLVTTVSRLQRDFPNQLTEREPPLLGRIASARYPIDPSRLSGKLAAFLAEHITTTRHDDSAGMVMIFTGRTVADEIAINGLGGFFGPLRASKTPQLGTMSAYADWLDGEVDRLAKKAKMVRHTAACYGDRDEYVLEPYRWPVFNESFEDAADYLNECAAAIRHLGLPVEVGLSRATPSDSLLESIDRTSFSRFKKYREQVASL